MIKATFTRCSVWATEKCKWHSGAYQYVIDSVPLLSSKLEHLLPVVLLVLVFCQTIKLQYFFCDELLRNSIRGKNNMLGTMLDLSDCKILIKNF